MDGVSLERLVGHLLQGNEMAAAVAGVGRHEEDRLGIVDAIAQRLALKPPKTTLWTAPMRAQASMAMASSGTSGR